MADYALGSTFDVKFATRSAGAMTALSGGTVVAYPDNSTTEVTGGITLTADIDAVTGLNNVRVVATSGNGYAAGSNYTLVLSAGTVGGTSVVGTPVGEFSLEAESALRPATAGRTAAIDASGQVTVGAMAADTLTASALAASAVTEIQSGLSTLDAAGIRTAVGLASANLDTQIGDLPTNAELTAALASADDAVLAAIAALNNLSSAGAQAAAAAALTAYGAALTSDIPTTAQIADKVLGRNLAGSSDGGRTVKDALRTLRNKVNIDATTVTVYQEDDTTTAWSGVATRADLDALQTVDPS